MNFDELIQLQVLKLKASVAGAHPCSSLVVDRFDAQEGPEVRQMCAKVSVGLYDRLDKVANALDMSKREFIEWAVSDAIDRAEDSLKKNLGGTSDLWRAR